MLMSSTFFSCGDKAQTPLLVCLSGPTMCSLGTLWPVIFHRGIEAQQGESFHEQLGEDFSSCNVHPSDPGVLTYES